MFSGLIRHIGEITKYQNNILSIKSDLAPKIGDSIAVNGACLSVISTNANGFDLEISTNSLKLLNIQNIKGKVHLEQALRLDDRLDGHIVQGHIDAFATITNIEKLQSGHLFSFSVEDDFVPLLVPKGSIAINGISLTIFDVRGNIFATNVIPITFKETLFHTYKIGQKVQIESDIFARSVLHMLKIFNAKESESSDKYEPFSPFLY